VQGERIALVFNEDARPKLGQRRKVALQVGAERSGPGLRLGSRDRTYFRAVATDRSKLQRRED
jgi:hypothetical protein